MILSPVMGNMSGVGIMGLQLLPGGLLGGALMGASTGLLKNSETFKETLFGKKDDNGRRSGKFLSDNYNALMSRFPGAKDGAIKGLRGAAIGSLSYAVLSNMGFLPAMLSAGGPIGFGIAGLGLGIASSTKKFDEWMFGTEEFDENGDATGKRKGGMLGKVRNLLYGNVVEPISTAFRENMFKLIDWTRSKITLPFREAFGPILGSISGMKDDIVDFVKDKFDTIGDGIKDTLQFTIKKIFSPMTSIIGKIGKAAIGAARIGAELAMSPAAAGIGIARMLGSGQRGKEAREFYRNYYTEGGFLS